MPSLSYRLPFCLWPLSLKLCHLFTIVDRHQYLPHDQHDQANTHNREGNPKNDHWDRLRTAWKQRGWDKMQTPLLIYQFLYAVVKLTIYLEVIGSGPFLTSYHIKGDPALVFPHHSALHWSALIIWEEMRMHIHKEGINSSYIIFPFDIVLRE